MSQLPLVIRKIDAGAEFIRSLPNGDTVWGCVIKPPSGIEKDVALVAMANGLARKATEEDFNA